MRTSDPGIRIHDFLPVSLANGPGRRAVLWVQGCSLGCPGCFNPETHPAEGPATPVTELVGRILGLGNGIDGLTLSGGEPFQQPRGILTLLRRIREDSHLTSIVFTGFSWEEIQKIPLARQAMPWIDVLITGRYLQSARVARGLQGSRNKQFHFLSGRYNRSDFENVPTTEITIMPSGEIVTSGIDPLPG